MSREPNTVVYAADQQYAAHAFVSIYSMLLNNQALSFDIRIFSSTKDRNFFEKAKWLKRVHSSFTLTWVPVDPNLISDAPIMIDRFSVATYYRFLVASVLPEGVQRILYIDADTLVRGSLAELVSLDLDGKVLAAIPNFFGDHFESIYGHHSERLGMDADSLYFNAGVLLIDMVAWRDREVERRCFEFMRCARNRLMYQDQDVLNVVLSGDWLPVGPNYNHVEWTLDSKRCSKFDPATQPGGLIPPDGPVIAHFAHDSKPWDGDSPHPYAHEYWWYRGRTPYANRYLLVRCNLVTAGMNVVRFVARAVRKAPFGEALINKVKVLSGKVGRTRAKYRR